MDFVNKIIQYKLEIINNIFKIVDESYSGTIITEDENRLCGLDEKKSEAKE